MAAFTACVERDYDNVIDPAQTPAMLQRRVANAYAALKRAVREAERLPPRRDIGELEDAVANSVPARYQPKIRTPLRNLSTAHAEQLLIHERCAFLIGRALGRRRRR